MSGHRREANRQAIMEQIKSNFLTLYAEGGLDHISIGALCERCGIARSTFYYYYDDKYSVLESIENELIDALWNINSKFGWDIDDIRAGIPSPAAKQTILYIADHIGKFKILLNPYANPQFVHKWKRGLEQHFSTFFMTIKGDPLSAEAACTIFSSAAIGLFTKYVLGTLTLTPEAFSIILGNLLKYSLSNFQSATER